MAVIKKNEPSDFRERRPEERAAVALERIAAALEKIANKDDWKGKTGPG